MVKETKKKQSRRRRERRGFWLPVLILCLIVAGGFFWGYKSGWFSKKSKNDETAVVDTKSMRWIWSRPAPQTTLPFCTA